jgi:hypothetical protein
MSKFGVGVGDDFPVDDGNGQGASGNQGQPRDDRADYEEWKRRREAHRAQREQWRAQREEWRNRKRAFKEKIRAAARESFGDDWEDRRYGRGGFGYGRRGFPFGVALIPVLGIVLVVALFAAIIKSPFVFLALALVGFFFFAHRFHHHGHRFAGHGWHGHDRHGHDRHGRDYDFDLKPSPEAKTNNDAAVTPPPTQTSPQTPPSAPQDGGK